MRLEARFDQLGHSTYLLLWFGNDFGVNNLELGERINFVYEYDEV